MKDQGVFKWMLFVILSLVWGSSFFLILEGLKALSPWQVAAMRLFSAGIVVLPFTVGAMKRMPREKIGYTILSGLLGSFIPAFLFCLAELRLDGSFAGALNSLTPIFVLTVGMLFFSLRPTTRQVAGIVVSFTGSVLLFMAKGGKTGDILYVFFIIIATVCYGLNVNMVGRRLAKVSSTDIAVVAFSFLTIPSALVLFFTGIHQLDFEAQAVWQSLGASALLGIFGTAVASILFYVLMKKAGGVFASTVTYGIPFVALGWGWIGHELITWQVIASLFVILFGIVLANTRLFSISRARQALKSMYGGR